MLLRQQILKKWEAEQIPLWHKWGSKTSAKMLYSLSQEI